MDDVCQLPGTSRDDLPAARWSVGGLLLEAIAARDLPRLSGCFDPQATMRALLPSGPTSFTGHEEISGAFRKWFGAAQGFEVLDGTVGDIGGRLHLSWRLRVHPTPRGDDRWHVIEQQAFAHAAERITSMDLLCSGFLPEGQVTRSRINRKDPPCPST